jgi:hypothetical protein
VTHPLGTPRGLPANAGILASAGWLVARGLYIQPDKPWRVDIVVPCAEYATTSLAVHIRNEDWSIAFDHAGKRSSILIKEVAPEAQPDDHALLGIVPPLKELGLLLRYLEERFAIRLQRGSATVEATIAGSEPIIRAWVASL